MLRKPPYPSGQRTGSPNCATLDVQAYGESLRCLREHVSVGGLLGWAFMGQPADPWPALVKTAMAWERQSQHRREQWVGQLQDLGAQEDPRDAAPPSLWASIVMLCSLSGPVALLVGLLSGLVSLVIDTGTT
jgi:hypothetical protein